MQLTSWTLGNNRQSGSLAQLPRTVRESRRYLPEIASLEDRTLLSTLYAVGSGVGNGSSNLYEIANYASTPTAVNIGETGVLLTDLAINPKNDAAYAISFHNLYSINLITGKVTDIGPLDASGMNALTFSSSGTLYAMSTYNSDLYTVNLSTGQASAVFDTGYISEGAIAFDSSGALYLTTATELVKINVSAETAIAVGPTGVPRLFGLVIDSNGNLYTGQGSNEGPTAVMYQLNETTGHATKIGTIAGASKLGLDGLSFDAPSPSTEELAQILYAVGSGVGDGSSDLYEIANYASSPKAVNIGETGVLLTDLAINPKNDAAYAISATDLYSINLSTAKVTDIGTLGASGMNALSFSASGALYAMSGDSSDLYKLNLKTGHATVDLNTGYISAGGIAFGIDGALYLTTATDLVRIKVSANKATDLGSTGVPNLFGLVVAGNGNVYAGQGSNDGPTAVMYRINDTTGHATKIGRIAGASKLGLEGLSF